jgi:hypothetical protein
MATPSRSRKEMPSRKATRRRNGIGLFTDMGVRLAD